LQAKSGKPLGRYFPEVVALLRGLAPDTFVVDGELLVQSAGRFSFEALQMRLHPSESRIRRLAAGTPATLTLFDMLVAPTGADLRSAPLVERRGALERFAASLRASPALSITPGTADRALGRRPSRAGLRINIIAGKSSTVCPTPRGTDERQTPPNTRKSIARAGFERGPGGSGTDPATPRGVPVCPSDDARGLSWPTWAKAAFPDATTPHETFDI